MRQGVINVATFYAIGIATTLMCYLVFGQEHGQGLYLIIFLLTLLIGFFWTGGTIINYYFKNKTEERKGIIVSNIMVLLTVTLSIWYIQDESTKDTRANGHQEQLSTYQSGDSIIIKYNESMIYLKIGDSLYFDKQDSLLRTWNK